MCWFLLPLPLSLLARTVTTCSRKQITKIQHWKQETECCRMQESLPPQPGCPRRGLQIFIRGGIGNNCKRPKRPREDDDDFTLMRTMEVLMRAHPLE